MKTYLEVADDVFQKGEACLRQKRERQQRIKTRAAFAVLAAVILFSAFGITKGLMPRKTPPVLPASSNAPQTATTAQSGETISETEPDPAPTSTQNAAPGSRTTNPKESGAAVTRAAQSGTASQTAASSAASPGETTSALPDETGTKAPTDGPAPTQTTTGAASSATETTAPLPTEPTKPGDTPTDEPSENSTADARTSTRTLAPDAASLTASRARLKAAVEDNACGWIKIQNHCYVQDDPDGADAAEPGEFLGNTADFEGNLALLGLSGEVFRLVDETFCRCLLLKTDDGRALVFVPVAGTD